ncbi:hypothetical protein [Cellulomonas xylanilytica]|uniref:Uncharacterized protein n=1 Tax=Cellulomonas xylanilytica TaxID=233583 RepID=A0A510V9M7_9CELL|nr:hypothetical protein [Cellulomonas xylanilytica]GEK23573.1 hypothetical protein CXY01_40930 [Cellulomonas xylanilytica]
MNTKIQTPDAVAFLPRSVAPTMFWLHGIALPIGGSALAPIGGGALAPIGGSKRRTATDPRTYLTRTPMI